MTRTAIRHALTATTDRLRQWARTRCESCHAADVPVRVTAFDGDWWLLCDRCTPTAAPTGVRWGRPWHRR